MGIDCRIANNAAYYLRGDPTHNWLIQCHMIVQSLKIYLCDFIIPIVSLAYGWLDSLKAIMLITSEIGKGFCGFSYRNIGPFYH